MSFRNAQAAYRFAFPNRVCSACERRGGGDPEAGLDNVTVEWGVEICGHCTRAFHAQLNMGALMRQWAADRRRSLEVTKP